MKIMQDKIFAQIKGLILDMDGVLWRDQEPIGDLPAIFRAIQERGWQVILATNNATRTAVQFGEKLAGFGVHLDPNKIVNSSQATAEYLRQRFPQGGPVYVVGEQGLITELAAKGFYPDDEQPLAVVVGLDRAISYEKLMKAARHVRAGVPFVATNPDKTYPTPDGQVPGAGTMVAAVAAASDSDPVIIGKPEPEMYRIALRRMGLGPEQVLVVGDRLETDIVGAQQLGCHCAIVLSGVSSRRQAEEWRPAPDFIAADLDSLLRGV